MEKDLGYRRIQSTGRGSYIISLPKEWVKELGLKKGSEMEFKLQDDSSLMIVPGEKSRKEKDDIHKLKEYWIRVDPKEDPKSLCRRITSLYVISADLIHFRFREGDAPRYKMAINYLVKNTLLGAEIIDETSNDITLQILVSNSEFPVEKAIRRMATLALSANKDAVSALKIMDENLIQGVFDTYNDVMRLNPYIIRQLKFSLERNLFKELGFKSPKEFLGYRIVVNDLKSLAENALNIVNNIVALKKLINEQTLFLKEPIDEEIYSQLLHFTSMSHQLFEESLKAMFKRSYENADEIISKIESFNSLENDLITLISNKKLDPNISSIFRLILDDSRQIMQYSLDVAEVTLNRTIEEISATKAF
jgi:phosphate uptake regulator